MEKKLRSDELGRKGYRILQDPDAFCFGVDAVLLAAFAQPGIRPGSEVLDLCSGNGVIPILLDARMNARRVSPSEKTSTNLWPAWETKDMESDLKPIQASNATNKALSIIAPM